MAAPVHAWAGRAQVLNGIAFVEALCGFNVSRGDSNGHTRRQTYVRQALGDVGVSCLTVTTRTRTILAYTLISGLPSHGYHNK